MRHVTLKRRAWVVYEMCEGMRIYLEEGKGHNTEELQRKRNAQRVCRTVKAGAERYTEIAGLREHWNRQHSGSCRRRGHCRLPPHTQFS